MKTARSAFDWKKWRVITGIYLLTNIAFVVQRVIFDLQQGKPEDIISSLIDLAGFAGIWILFTIPILYITTQSPLSLKRAFLLFIAGIVLSFLHGALYILFDMFIPGVMTSPKITTLGEYVQMLAGLGHAWRFLSFGFLVVVSFAYDYYYLSKEREYRASQLQIQLTESKLNALKMQLHPHFLFNTLNAISVLIDENPSNAKQTLAQLSDLLRLALENVETHEVPLRRELEFLDRYLLIQKTRYESRLTVHTNIAEDTMNAAVPYLLLQPIVENALKHGIDTMPGPGVITISAVRQNGKTILQVEDTGPGIHSSLSVKTVYGFGLTNIQARMKQLYGEQYAFIIEDVLEGHGARVTCSIPYKPATSIIGGENKRHA